MKIEEVARHDGVIFCTSEGIYKVPTNVMKELTLLTQRYGDLKQLGQNIIKEGTSYKMEVYVIIGNGNDYKRLLTCNRIIYTQSNEK